MSTAIDPRAAGAFRRAADMASQNLLAEAASAFSVVVEEFPRDPLADDALYNVGACLLALNQHARAAEVFRQVIARYPDAEISDTGPGRHESGRTAARAWLGLVAAQLGLGDAPAALDACEKLQEFPDSVVRPAPGVERSFHDVGRSLLVAASVVPEECDEVEPDAAE